MTRRAARRERRAEKLQLAAAVQAAAEQPASAPVTEEAATAPAEEDEANARAERRRARRQRRAQAQQPEPAAAPEAPAAIAETPGTPPPPPPAPPPVVQTAAPQPPPPAVVNDPPDEPPAEEAPRTRRKSTRLRARAEGDDLPSPATRVPGARRAPSPEAVAAAANPAVPMAGPARLRRRHTVIIATFIACVVLPAITAAWYLWTIALDQYASSVGFSVHREENGSAVELLGGITELSGSSSTDTDILYKYIQSRELIGAVNADLNLVNIYTRPEDPLYSLPANPTIEDLEDQWERMVDIFYDTSSHLIEVRVRAFRPEDAHAISDRILAESTAKLNEITATGRGDATRYASEELELAKTRLRDARQALTAFRIRSQIVDPAADVQGRMGLLNSLLAQQATALIDLDMVAATANQNDPRYIQAQRRVQVIEDRLRAERARFGDQPAEEDQRYADLVAEFEALSVDLEFAQQAYLTSLATYDAAVAEAQRQSRYLATYLPPTMAERSEYPQRLLLFALFTGAALALWSIGVMVYYTVRDRI